MIFISYDGKISSLVEEWRPIVLYNEITNYEVSNLGKVRNRKTKKCINPFTDKDGYLHATITFHHKLVHRGIHRFVAIAFIPIPQKYLDMGYTIDDLQVNHIDGNKTHNISANLEWCTCKENIIHACKTGLRSPRFGEKSPNHKYNTSQITRVCELLELGGTAKEISEITGVNRKYITDIKKRRRWTPISNNYKF